MRRLLTATAAAAVLLATPAPSLAEDCLGKKLSGAELEQCLGKKNPSEPGGTTKGAKQAEEIKYPFRITPHWNHYLIYKHDPIKRENTTLAEIFSEDSSKLTITTGTLGAHRWAQFKPAESITIQSSNIIGWTISDQAYQDSTAAVSNLVSAAIFFPPMILLSPFLIQNVQISYINISYLDELGNKQSVQLVSESKDAVKLMISMIKAVSTLEAGLQKSDKELADAYKVIQEELRAKVLSLRASLLVPNKKKPWCEQIDPKSLPNIYAKYQQLYARLQKIQESLEMPVLQLTDGSNNDEQWNNWLIQNPNQAIWAKSNPVAADKLRRCGIKA
jgi:hypothetical protein